MVRSAIPRPPQLGGRLSPKGPKKCGCRPLYAPDVVFWAVVSYEINRVIEWFPSRVEAQRMLDVVVADEPRWRWTLCVEPIVLTTGGRN
jgi:hypothetical protein